MAVLASIATGNFSSSGTWGVVDSTSYLNAESGSEILTTAYSGTRSQTFTPGAITISHLAVKLSVRTGTTGTISVELITGGVPVSGTEVTIDCADLPVAATNDVNGGWVMFKLSSPILLLAATAYSIEAKTSSSSQVSLFRNATTDNISRMLITTTNAAPTTGDDIVVAGEYTGSGTSNSFTVTMDNTATTDFGSAPSAANSLITPGLSICSKGTLTYGTSSSTNYYFKVSNSVVVYSGGTLNIGTTGTPIPRDSTAVLEFDPASDGDYGLIVRNLGTCNMQGLSRTSGKNIVACMLNTDEATNSTSLGVDTDTGWLDNDVIVVASTSRTPAESESGTLNGNAGASSLTVDGFAGAGGGLAADHSGTSPTQAEVILLTRNVKVRSATSTIMAYVNVTSTSSVDIDWTEFYYLGENASNKRGIEILTGSSGSFSLQYSSLHDIEDGGVYINSNTGSYTISNNVFYNLNSTASTAPAFRTLATSGAHTMNSNTFIYFNSVNGGAGLDISDMGSDFSNNSIVAGVGSSTTYAISFNELSASSIGSMSGNVVHSCSNHGVVVNSSFLSMQTMGSMKIYRCGGTGGAGLAMVSSSSDNRVYNITFDTWTLFGNQLSNIGDFLTQASRSYFNVIFKNASVQGDSSSATTYGFSLNRGGNPYKGKVVFIDSSFGTTTAHTSGDINTAGLGGDVILINTTLSSTTDVIVSASVDEGGVVRAHKLNGSSTTFKNWFKKGLIEADQTTRHTASGFSWKMTPNTANAKLILPTPLDFFRTAVNANEQVTISVYIQYDGSYNGNMPRLVVLGGILSGISSDVTDTATTSNSGNWEQLSVQVTPTEAGVLEYYIDCDGTAGSVYVDDIEISQA